MIAAVLILITDGIDNIKIPLFGLVVYGAAWIIQALEFVRDAGKKIERT